MACHRTYRMSRIAAVRHSATGGASSDATGSSSAAATSAGSARASAGTSRKDAFRLMDRLERGITLPQWRTLPGGDLDRPVARYEGDVRLQLHGGVQPDDTGQDLTASGAPARSLTSLRWLGIERVGALHRALLRTGDAAGRTLQVFGDLVVAARSAPSAPRITGQPRGLLQFVAERPYSGCRLSCLTGGCC